MLLINKIDGESFIIDTTGKILSRLPLLRAKKIVFYQDVIIVLTGTNRIEILNKDGQKIGQRLTYSIVKSMDILDFCTIKHKKNILMLQTKDMLKIHPIILNMKGKRIINRWVRPFSLNRKFDKYRLVFPFLIVFNRKQILLYHLSGTFIQEFQLINTIILSNEHVKDVRITLWNNSIYILVLTIDILIVYLIENKMYSKIVAQVPVSYNSEFFPQDNFKILIFENTVYNITYKLVTIN